MAVLSAVHPNLADFARRQGVDGKIEALIEMIAEENEILEDMVWKEGNLPTGSLVTVRTGLPTVTWRRFNSGVQPSKSRTAQITAACGMLEAYAEVDKALADLNGNTAAWRMSEDAGFIEQMSQEMADTLFYGNEGTEPEAFTGLAPHYNSLSAESADNVIQDSNGTQDTSIWLVVWGDNTLHGIVPKGSKSGLQMNDKGQVTIEDFDGSGGRMEAYRTHYRWDAGLVVKDWRYAVRMQFDYSALSILFSGGQFNSGNSPNLPDMMFQALRLIPSLSKGKPCFYASRDVASWIARQKAAMGISGGAFGDADKVAGDMRWTENFNGVPIRRVDALATTETAIS